MRNLAALSSDLGFTWDERVVPTVLPIHEIRRVCFRWYRSMPEYIWDAAILEGNPFTFPEVKTLLDGITVGGRKVADAEQILNLFDSSKELLRLVRNNLFTFDRQTSNAIHALVARNEALEWGHLRGEGQETHFTPDVALGEAGRHTPLPTTPGGGNLAAKMDAGISRLRALPPYERGLAYFLFAALHQFYFDGNKRTGRFMMNGILMSNGIDAISVPGARANEFNQAMVRFYVSKDATEMMGFLTDCHPEIEQIRAHNPAMIPYQSAASSDRQSSPPQP
jgi:hypothetical protein